MSKANLIGDALAQHTAETGTTGKRVMYLGRGDGLGTLPTNDPLYPRSVWAHELNKQPEQVLLPDWPVVPLRNDPGLEGVVISASKPPGESKLVLSLSRDMTGQQALGTGGQTPFEIEHNQLASILLTFQPANWIFAAPDVASASSGQPGFRRLLNNDLALSATPGQSLIAGATAPSWSALALDGGASSVSGVLPLLNGGTGSNLSATGPGYLQQATNGANVTLLKSNLTASVAPAVTDDGAHGYAIGSQWVDTVGKKAYVLVDASTGAAVWDSTTTGSLLTTKGDLLTFSTADIRLGVGANNTVLVADSAQATGNKWSASLTGLTLDNGNTITLKDTLFTLQDDGDTSKQLVFQLSGISTATTRTLTAPNASGTIALTATTGQGYVMIAPAATADNLIAGATTTIDLLTLKTTDDNTTKVALRVLSSAAATVASVGATGLAVFAGINSTPIGATTPNTVAATTISGTSITATTQFIAPAGSHSVVSYAFSGQLNTGMWSPSSTQIFFEVAGSTKLQIDTTNGLLRTNGLDIGTDTGIFKGVGGVTLVFQSGNTNIIRFRDSSFNVRMLIDSTGNIGFGNANTSPTAIIDAAIRDTSTGSVSNVAKFRHTLTTANAGAANIGVDAIWEAADSTSAIGASIQVARIRAAMPIATHLSRTGLSIWSSSDAGGERDVIGIGGNGSAGLLGFYPTIAAAPIVQPASSRAIDLALSDLGLRAAGTPALSLLGTYNADTLAGNGLASVVGYKSLTGQTASIAASSFSPAFTPPVDGMYEAQIYLEDTTASTSGGTVQASIIYTDDNGSQTQSTATLVLNVAGFTSNVFTFFAKTSAQIQYSTTVSGVIVGSPQYAVRIVIVRLT